MTAHQFAIAAGGTRKWVQNTSMILGRHFRRTREEARWLGLVRTLNQGLEMPLHAAAELATRLLLRDGGKDVASPKTEETAVARIVVDRDLYDSIANARLSRALVLEGPKTRGRRPATATNPLILAERYGIDLSLLRDSLGRSPAERLAALNENAAFLAAARSGRRGGTLRKREPR